MSVADRLFGPIFESLRYEQFFAQVSVDEYGVICWPNGADLAPDALYQDLKAANAQGRECTAAHPIKI